MTKKKQPVRHQPKVLLFDIETAPLLAYTWGLWDQNIALNQIHTDWYVLSWSAKWLDDPPSAIMYQDQRKAKNIEDDSRILKALWKLLDEADIVITQNGKAFDEKKLNARFIMHGFQPPSPFKHIDTLRIAKRKFGFTSNKLEYMTNKLCTKYKKLKHKKFAGFELWRACLAGNVAAWNEMEKYNKYDVLSLEELYRKLVPWDDKAPNFNLWSDATDQACKCGSNEFAKRGYTFTTTGKFQCYRCTNCGAHTRDKTNLLSKEKKTSLRSGV